MPYNILPVKYKRNFSYILIALLIAGLLLWVPYLHLIENNLSTFYDFIYSSASPNFSSALLTASKANLQDLISSTIFIYGVLLIITLTSLISVYELTKKNISIIKRYNNIFDIFLSLRVYEIFSIIGFLLFTIFSLLVYFKLPLFGFTRIMTFATLFSNFLIFTLFYIILESKNRKLNLNKYMKIIAISVIILPIICISTLNLYDSPYSLTPNEQVTISEVNGMDTFFNNYDTGTKTLTLGISEYRFLAYIQGEQTDQFGQDIHMRNLSDSSRTTPIDHFGFNNNTTLGQYYNNSVYLLINQVGFQTYPKIFPGYEDKWRFTPQDFKKLNNTSQNMLIYNNGNLKIYISN